MSGGALAPALPTRAQNWGEIRVSAISEVTPGLAREHGINRTAKALHLEYGKLKERAEAPGQEKKVVRKARSVIQRHARPPAPPTFMELITPRLGSVAVRWWSWKDRGAG